MSLWDFARDPSSIRLLLDFGEQRGVGAEALLDKTELTADLLSNPSAELSAAQELRVIENLLRAMRYRPGLGLELGLTCNFSAFGMWGYGVVSSATLGDAVNLALRFIQLSFAYSIIEQVHEGGQAQLTFSPPDLPTGIRRFVVERDMGAAACLLKEIGGESFHLNEFCLQAGKGRAYVRHDKVGRICGAEPCFDADRYYLSFDSKFLDFKLPKANPVTVAMCEHACQQLVLKRQSRMSTMKFVEAYIGGSTVPRLPTLESLAKLTNTSERTLKRRLQKEGTSFRTLVASGRATIASELVDNTSLTLTDVAERLGYADLSTFSQAFKRWFGVSPAEYRRRRGSSVSRSCG
ncbi:hypothetical protein JY96_06425 [Aquabacterium sp. NJ1]|uniref:AraC family transcriptional regulator n=1 Tax=Aquabacterium sp. NJ1 TaxID=1538295 RepID=UPI00052DA2F9|nr:AraC family transcriptional regulator [Aquabacterium sp. NJ1]KGM39790.1 hypothetical protein JY96_06425 [Aquabacterium sp. NJ1]